MDIRHFRVRDAMSRDVVYVDVTDTVLEALERMRSNRVSGLPVVDGHGHCVGVISTSDILDLTEELEEGIAAASRIDAPFHQLALEHLADSDLGTRLVSEVMTHEVVHVTPEANLAQAAKLMLTKHVHRVIVVDKARSLQGIVSTTDILRVIADGTDL